MHLMLFIWLPLTKLPKFSYPCSLQSFFSRLPLLPLPLSPSLPFFFLFLSFLPYLPEAHCRVRADAGEEGQFRQKMQGLAIIFRQRGVQRKMAFADKAGALVFLHIDEAGFNAGLAEKNALDEVLQVFHRQGRRAGELPFVGEVAKDVARHRQRQRLLVFNEAGGRFKPQRDGIAQLAALGLLPHGFDDLAEAAQLRPVMLLRQNERRAGHELGIIRLRPVLLLAQGSDHALDEVGVHAGEAVPVGFALGNFEPAVALFKFAVQIRERVRPPLVVVVQQRDELRMVTLQPAQKRPVDDARRHGREFGVGRSREGEDEACEVGHC